MSTPMPLSAPTLTKVQQAEVWLRDYLKDGPKPIPDSYIKNGLCRYNYAPDALPPEGIGKKTIDQAMVNLGVIVSHNGPRGGRRWSLPKNKQNTTGDYTVSTTANTPITDTVTAPVPEWHNYLQPDAEHPAARLYPMLDKEGLQQMADNIKTVGLLNSIVLLDGKVLDGRNRLEACKLAGVEPSFREWEQKDISPIEWVLSQNSHRRHLSASQKAFVALEAEKMLTVEAKERQRMGKAKLPDPESKGQARDKAAKLVGVSGRYVQDAKRIQEKAPGLIPQIKAGVLSLQDAKKKTRASIPTKEKAPIELGDFAVRTAVRINKAFTPESDKELFQWLDSLTEARQQIDYGGMKNLIVALTDLEGRAATLRTRLQDCPTPTPSMQPKLLMPSSIPVSTEGANDEVRSLALELANNVLKMRKCPIKVQKLATKLNNKAARDCREFVMQARREEEIFKHGSAQTM